MWGSHNSRTAGVDSPARADSVSNSAALRTISTLLCDIAHPVFRSRREALMECGRPVGNRANPREAPGRAAVGQPACAVKGTRGPIDQAQSARLFKQTR